MDLPDEAAIRALHERHAPGRAAFDLVHTHCRIVAGIADALAARYGGPALDTDLVRAGCLLHDIGVYRLYGPDGTSLDHARYIRHGVLGDELLAAEGFPERLRRFCSHHTGVGITRDDITSRGLPLPVADYLAETPEERLVMYADKFHTKSSPPAFLSAGRYAEHARGFGEDKAAGFRRLRDEFGDPGHDELAALAARHGHAFLD
ncbi:HD domain-containing protein [Streptomyces sp. RFCAC02]|uniref:HD domain-containing protein n=1 Tax=Streptomyces sp. RFCAC02 TaxID=2499143 RepID=UPI001020DBA5|nr:HD domain-containing protein [Streptomyces sp. RFCAC02]